MALPVKTGLPATLDLPPGWTIRFIALDATTGAEVPDVVISSASIEARDLGPGVGQLETPDWVLVPGPE